MNTNESYYPDLITRYLSGEASPEEISELSAWIRSEPVNASVFDEYRRTWLGIVAGQVDQQVELDNEWEQLVSKASGLRHPLSSIQSPLSSIQSPVSSHQSPVASHQSPATSRQSLVTSSPSFGIRDPETVRMESSRPSWQIYLVRASLIAAIALVLLIPAWIAYRYFTGTELIRLTATSKILDAVLPDGSVVSLNAYSSLTYSENYGKTDRDVILNGEAYFEVNRDSLISFIIHCGSSRLEVLGTSFYVDAKADAGDMEVVLVNGSVTVYFEEARSTGKTIIPGEKAELNPANQRITVTPNEDPNFLAWKTHHLIFLDDRLDMIIATLNKVYQANISLANETLASCRLTATFDQQSLESVLSVIQVTLDIQSETTSSGIILFGKGCN